MALSDLNIRIMASTREWERSLRRLENQMVRFSQRMGAIGTDMAVGLTAPIIAFGAKAISAAGDSEALGKAMETTMKNAGYSIQKTAAELEALRKASLAPGLDLPQAVQGSVRLQSVRFSAEESRRTLVELANAVSTTGGTAQELESVTKQFVQMSSKGRILQEDLGIIQENMPAVSVAIQKAFGTSNVEALRAMGVDAKTFIRGVVDQLALLPRVEGGIKNALTNAGSAITQFFSGIGTEIARVFELGKGAEGLSDRLAQLTDYFRALDDETKRNILTWGLYIAAAGPVLKIFTTIVGAGGALINMLRGFIGVGASVVTSTNTMIVGFLKLNTAMKVGVIGLAITAVAGLTMAYDKLTAGLNKAWEAQNIFVEAKAEVNKQAGAEIATMQKNIEVLRTETTSREQKIKAFNDLKAAYPDLLGKYNSEKISLVELTALQNNLTKSIVARVAEEKKAALLGEQAQKIVEARLKLQDFAENGLGAKYGETQTKWLQFIGMETKVVTDNVNELNAEIAQAEQVSKQIEAQFAKTFGTSTSGAEETAANLYAIRDAEIDIDALNNKIAANWKKDIPEGLDKSKKKVKEVKDEFDKYLETVAKAEAAREKAAAVADKMGIGLLEQLPTANTTKNVQQGSDGQKSLSFSLVPVASLSEPFQSSAENLALFDVWAAKIQQIPQLMTPAQQAMASLRATFQGLTQDFSDGGAAQAATMEAVKNSVLQLSASGSTSLADFARAAVGSALQVAKAYATEAVFAAAASAFKVLPFPVNIVAAGLAAGGAAALMNGLTSKIKAPKLAKGGLAYGPTMAMVGDNRNAGVDPEVIAPLSKLNGIIGGRSEVTVRGVVSGNDLLLVQDRASNNRTRTTGRR